MTLRQVFGAVRDWGFRAKRVDEVPLPKVNPRTQWRELDRMNCVTGEINDVRSSSLGRPPSSYYNRREPNVDKELRRVRWWLGKLGSA